MREAYGNLWDVRCDAVVITTNGYVKRDGRAVMGRGCAREAAERMPFLPRVLGELISEKGNHVFDLKTAGGPTVVSFPVKDKWWQDAKPALVARSTRELVALTNRMGWRTVVMPRPGCGNGRLEWSLVRRILEPLLNDRFTVLTNEEIQE